MYPQLPKSYSNCFPFRIGTTSFIYPDRIIPNVKMLAPFLDEIELLLFESRSADSLPSKQDIGTLKSLAGDYNLYYNIHLPTDIALGASDPAERAHAVDSIKRIITRCAPLSPSTHTLHLTCDSLFSEPHQVRQWQENSRPSERPR